MNITHLQRVVTLSAMLCVTPYCLRAQEEQQVSAPHIAVTLDGGNASSNLSEILRLVRESGKLQTKTAKVSAGETVCGLLAKDNYPKPCTPLLGIIRSLNPSISNIESLAQGQEIVVPDVKIEKDTTEKAFSRQSNSEVRLNKLTKDWIALGAKISDESRTDLRVEYNSYNVEIPVKDPLDAVSLSKNIARQRIPNIAVEAGTPSARNIKLYAGFPDPQKIRDDCRNKLIATANRKYADLGDLDQDAIAFYNSSKTSAKTTIHIIDTQLDEMPNLYPAFGKAEIKLDPTWACLWEFDSERHHANHLASIIASQRNGTGFQGVWPDVILKSFDIRKPSALSTEIARYMNATSRGATPLPVYLFSLTIVSKRWLSPGGKDMPDRNTRFSDPLGRAIQRLRPLAIVAAGQRDKPEDQLEDIGPRTRLFPQNLGDLPSVVVVTACTNCQRGSATLWEDAFYSSGEWKFVHVAAPGGKPIAAWTSLNSLGSSNGTSQAAAYVAGVAAAMIDRYPATFRDGVQVKYRLQVCSSPLPVYSRATLTPNPDLDKLSAGVIDPAVCLLDPSKTWIKRGRGWESVSVRAWSPQSSFSVDGATVPFELRDVLRLLRSAEQTDGWSTYSDRAGEPGARNQTEGGLGQVRLSTLVVPSPGTALLSCDGSSIPLSSTTDVIPAVEGFQDDNCSANASALIDSR